MKRTLRCLLAALATAAVLAVPAALVRADDDLDSQQEKAVKEAVRTVSPTVVKIETSGGTEVVKVRRNPRDKGILMRRGVGPTTGLIVSADGYIISSAFNFANKPTNILVAVPGLKERRVAKVVAIDQPRMLVLLKIGDLPAGYKLPVPVATPKSEMEIGLTAIACGRTLSAEVDGLPSVAVGILSALDRIWGKAIQTDAKASPVNYGGPLIDLYGRVMGVLVPASPEAEGEYAGFEWYDSGVGFAVPLEDIYAVLPRMIKGTEKEPVILRRGYVGVQMRSNDKFETVPTVGVVVPGSAAEKAGIQPGDVITEVDGKSVRNYAQMMHRTGYKYEGDTIAIKVLRDKKEVAIPQLVLGSIETAFPQAFLGILPVRDDPDPGVEVRYVYPKSPAEAAGLKEGDRILKMANPQSPPAAPLTPITRGRDQLMGLFETARPGQNLKLEVKRKAGGKVETLTAKLAELPDVVPAKLPERSTAKKAPGAAKKVETGLQKKTSVAGDHTYYVYVPDNYDAKIAHSVVIWLHPLGKNKERDIEDFSTAWSSFCDDNNVILLCPTSEHARGWTPAEATFVAEAYRQVAANYTVDPRRVVAHGMGVGGEMALYLGFQMRTLIRGVAPVGASLGSNPREKLPNQPLSFFLVVGGKDPVAPGVTQTRERLQKFKYPVILRQVEKMGVEYIDGKEGVPTLEELVRWIDSLDRM